MKELQFLLSLKNNLSQPLGRAQQSLASFGQEYQKSLKATGMGAAGLLGVGLALKGVTGPAHELKGALDELSSRDVGADVLNAVSRAAAKFSTDYGVAAVDFVNSTTVIKSSLTGLSDRDLPRTAVAVNTLAVAAKGSADAAAGYISGLASVFDAESTRMGKAAFAENIASRTAWLIKNTGQDMAQIQSLLSGTKGYGSSYGVGMDEQLAVLSNLSSSVGGAAADAYKDFLRGARKGAKELGLSFTDAQGQLLAFPDILEKLQAKYGDSVAGNVALQEKLNKAFGGGAVALVKSWGASAKLRRDIHALGGSNGLDGAADMAGKMADNWQRVAQLGNRVRIAIGMPLLSAIQPGIDGIINGGAQFAKWLEMFPNISRQIGYLSTAIIVLTAVNATGSLIAGVAGMVWGTLKGVWIATTFTLKALVWALNIKARALQIATLWTALHAAGMKKLRAAILISSIAMRGFAISAAVTTVVAALHAKGISIAALAMRAYGAATMFAGAGMQLLMSPVTLVIAGVALLAAGVWYAVTHWDALKASIMDSRAFAYISGVFTSLKTVVSGTVEGIKNMFAGLWAWLKNSVVDALNWVVEKINNIPGINIDLASESVAPPVAGLAPPAGMTAPAIERGAVAKQTGGKGNVDNSRHHTEVNVYPPNGATFQSITESVELAAP